MMSDIVDELNKKIENLEEDIRYLKCEINDWKALYGEAYAYQSYYELEERKRLSDGLIQSSKDVEGFELSEKLEKLMTFGLRRSSLKDSCLWKKKEYE